jgi:hypothetical protein
MIMHSQNPHSPFLKESSRKRPVALPMLGDAQHPVEVYCWFIPKKVKISLRILHGFAGRLELLESVFG